MKFVVHVTLESDTTFGRGDGVGNRLDQEAWYEPDTGLPRIPGRRFRGILVQSCGDFLYQLRLIDTAHWEKWEQAALFLFGQEGSRYEDAGALHVSDLIIHPDLRAAVLQAMGISGKAEPGAVRKEEVWKAYTTIRTQTAIDMQTQAQARHSLRSRRLVVRGTQFWGTWGFTKKPDNFARALLYASLLGVRRGGLRRNRGSGKLRCEFDTSHEPNTMLKQAFDQLVQKEVV